MASQEFHCPPEHLGHMTLTPHASEAAHVAAVVGTAFPCPVRRVLGEIMSASPVCCRSLSRALRSNTVQVDAASVKPRCSWDPSTNIGSLSRVSPRAEPADAKSSSFTYAEAESSTK